ncbi:hypothetical protein BH11BAC2_BH11BAC2_16420 [soil metagenome]
MRFLQFLLVVCVFFLASCSATRKKNIVKQPVAITAPDTVKVIPVPEPIKEKASDTLVIGLLLPLQLEPHFTNDTLPDTNPLIMEDALPALHFYEGALSAVDSFANPKFKIRLKVIDCSGDSQQVSKIIAGKQLTGCQAIIAMAGSNLNGSLASAAQRLNVPVILLQSANRQFLEVNKNIWLAGPSNSTQLKEMAAFLYENFPASNFIAIYREQRKENELAAFFAAEIDSLAGKAGTCFSMNYKTGSWPTLQAKLTKQKRNILIIPTSDESYLSTLLLKLDESQKDYSFLLCGLPSWDKFESVNPVVLSELNTHIFNGLFIDQSNIRVMNFRKAFIDEYHADPMLQAYQAFDLVTYIAVNYAKYQKEYSKYLSLPNLEFPEMGYKYVPVCESCGLENKRVTVLKFGDYELKRVVSHEKE